MTNNALIQNIKSLEKELHWFELFLEARLAHFFNKEQEDPFHLHAAPDLTEDESIYAHFINHYQLKWGERLVLILCLIPHIKPEILDPFLIKDTVIGRYYTIFGGLAGQNHNGFLPTGETAVFLLAENNLLARNTASQLFDVSHVFYQYNILKLEETKIGEPRLSGLLTVSDETLSLITQGIEYEPPFSARFPARILHSPMSWNDLVLDAGAYDEIETIKVWMDQKDNPEWDNVTFSGWMKGYRVLFYGLPGTGKSLTAALLGKACGKSVYRIDLSQIVSKYIGETEKNLASLFQLSENKNWILFFDEADALFGKRTELTDAKDKYANQETSYLLQRIEDFQGLIILATNFKPNIDSAFLRRFQSIVYFKLPGVHQREKLWEKALSRLPGDNQVDILKIASDYEISGGFINNAVQFAWLNARKNNSKMITNQDVLLGIKREYAKEGKIFNN
ncbi:MAG: ATP-binding protein [Bacteroidetes bacterium]|nr:ATP-binding protein [Bacteroidota bacterium]